MLKLILVGLLAISPVFGKSIILEESNMVVMDQDFNASSTSKVIKDIMELAKDLKSPKDIYLVLSSPGGEIGVGLMMIDTLNSIPNIKVHTVTLFAASMGFITVQGLGDRLITPSGTLMTHKAKGGFQGEFPGQLDSRYNYYLRRLARLDKNVIKRSGGIHTLKSYQDLMENEYWCEGQDCVNQGFADSVINLSCGKSLIKDVIEDIVINFFGMAAKVTVKRSRCPLILGVEQVEATINGKPYNFKNPMINEKINKEIDNRFNRRIK